MEFDWRNTGDYVRYSAEHSSAPPTWKESRDRFFGCGLCSFVPRQRDLPRKTRRLLLGLIVSGSLCVCARSLLITDICSEFC